MSIPALAAQDSFLSTLWAKNYVKSPINRDRTQQLRRDRQVAAITSKEGRIYTAKRLLRHLQAACVQAWSKTEQLLEKSVQERNIPVQRVNPWLIAADAHQIFEKLLHAYGERATPRRVSVWLGQDIEKVRHKYTSKEPRVIGFVSMQFHYTGQLLLEELSRSEQSLLEPFLKVVDDHLYIPLGRLYDAAANHDQNSTVLNTVQTLLPQSSEIAATVYRQVAARHPGYRSYSGLLVSETVKTSSLRDVEMFMSYLLTCALEGDFSAAQQELFPLCLILYPVLGVRWELVREMLGAIAQELCARLTQEEVQILLPYLMSMTELFSAKTLQYA